MNIGTRSVLFGVHQFLLHPVLVFVSFLFIYGRRPSWRVAICIFFHDVGYWRKENMDGEEGIRHPELGADIVSKLLGNEYRDIILFHSRAYADKHEHPLSIICLPDKLAMLLYPNWLYLLLSNLSGEITEYKSRMGLEHLSDKKWLMHTKKLAYTWAKNNTSPELIPRLDKYFSRLAFSKSLSTSNVSIPPYVGELSGTVISP